MGAFGSTTVVCGVCGAANSTSSYRSAIVPVKPTLLAHKTDFLGCAWGGTVQPLEKPAAARLLHSTS